MPISEFWIKNSRSEASRKRAFLQKWSIEMIVSFFQNWLFLAELFRFRCEKAIAFFLLRRREPFKVHFFYKSVIFPLWKKIRNFFLGKIFIPRKPISRFFDPDQVKKRRGKLIFIENR